MSQPLSETKKTATGDIRIQGVEMNPSFSKAIEKLCGENATQCYQCGECTAGCPAAFAMEFTPNRIMRMVQLGCEMPVLKSSTIWLCAGCETCATRCPRGLSVAKVMDACREIAASKGVKSGEPKVTTFHKAFLDDVARNGRAHEAGLIAVYKMKSRDFFSDVPLGVKMFLKGKLAILPSRINGLKEVRKIMRKLADK
jgi:heterodisulfide reductase subunit C